MCHVTLVRRKEQRESLKQLCHLSCIFLTRDKYLTFTFISPVMTRLSGKSLYHGFTLSMWIYCIWGLFLDSLVEPGQSDCKVDFVKCSDYLLTIRPGHVKVHSVILIWCILTTNYFSNKSLLLSFTDCPFHMTTILNAEWQTYNYIVACLKYATMCWAFHDVWTGAVKLVIVMFYLFKCIKKN